MNNLKVQLFILLLASIASAQVVSENLSDEVDAEIEKMYQSAPQAKLSSSAPVYKTQILAVQKQPITVIEATPLSASSAESIRKNRLDEEMRTESRIVEKLEVSRMEDEKRRAAILFGDKFDSLNHKESEPKSVESKPVEAAAPIVAPSSQIQPQPIIIQQAASVSKEDIQNEVRAALDDDKAAAEPEISLFERKYFTAIAGVPQYADAQGIQGQYSIGLALGTTNEFLQVEGGFIFSNYLIANAQYVAQNNSVWTADFIMSQYQTFVAAKFQLLDGSVRPNIGGLGSYSFRKYKSDSYTTYGNPGTEFGQSNAMDLGITGGVDLVLSKKFALGADLKYMFNLTSNINGSTAVGAKTPEKLSYYLLGVTAKIMF